MGNNKVKKYNPKKQKKAFVNASLNSNFTKKVRQIDFKRHMLIALQALCGALIGVCFFVYNASASITIRSAHETSTYVPSLYEITEKYYESQIYKENLTANVADILRYVAIKQQVEEGGAYSGDRPINVCEYAGRRDIVPYNGFDVEYRLDDLIKWGQKAASETYSFYSYEFYTFEEYCNFFNIDPETVEQPGKPESEASEESIQASLENESGEGTDEETSGPKTYYASFETFANLYLTLEGKRLEEYVNNPEDYRYLSSCVIQSAKDLYSNYAEYLDYKKQFTPENTNIRYYVSFTDNGERFAYTNMSGLGKGVSDSKLSELFKGLGEYIYACPGSLEYTTNTPIEYDTIKYYSIDTYGYVYPDDTKIWIGLDTTLPVEDIFMENMKALDSSARLIPFMVSLAVISIAGFIALFVALFFHEKKRYSCENAKELLSDFDRLPFEASLLFFILSVVALYLGEKIIIRNILASKDALSSVNISIIIGLIFLDISVGAAYLYGFIRRLLCKNLFDNSLLEMLSPHFSTRRQKIAAWFWKVYDSSGVALRTWVSYVLFLCVNAFFACLLFFSKHPFLAFFVIFAFDISIGAVLFNRNWERHRIIEGIRRISDGQYDFAVDSTRMHGDNKEFAEAVNNIGLGLGKAVEISTKDEKLKADLITNVSHDIKTPLTSIINYVDLLKRENIDNEKVRKYISILDEKSQRLRQLTFDLVEASKITSGNIQIDLIKIDFVEFLKQAAGEFEDKFTEKKLSVVMNVPKTPVMIEADPRHMWRVIENLFNNIYKYALSDTRVYIDLVTDKANDRDQMVLSIKNISDQKLNIQADELTERFIRGDLSRSTEGSGLGLSIAKSLTIAQKGKFDIYLDGDLFKVTLTFDIDAQ